jgi:hypothetical protein
VKHIKNCIGCGVELKCPDNWWFSFVGKKHYKCVDCYDTRRTENTVKKLYKEGKQPSPKLLARLFGDKHKKEYNTIDEGDVYIITNPAWKGWMKVGMALDAKDRLKSYQTSSPLRDYKLNYKKYFKDRRSAESTAHRRLKRICKDFEGEWFYININKVKEVIESI